MSESREAWVYKKVEHKTGSFAGGVPYFYRGEAWPRHEDGTPYRFLFQVDLSQVKDIGLDLPHTGYLQFFHYPDDLFGLDLDDMRKLAERNRSLVRYVKDAEDLDVAIPSELLGNMNFYTPLNEPDSRVYYEGEYYVMRDKTRVFDQDDDTEQPEDPPFESEFPDFEPEFYLGGEPFFTQEDFRSGGEYPHITLLLGSFSGDNIIWGDMGAGGFWISDDALLDLDFEESFIYWDCY